MHRINIMRLDESTGLHSETGYSADVEDEFEALHRLIAAQPYMGYGSLDAVTEDGQVAASLITDVKEVWDRA